MKAWIIKILMLLTLSGPLIAETTQDAEEQYPTRPITLLIGFEPGGTMYTLAEIIAELLAEELDQPVNIQARSGLGGGTAAAMLAKSDSEGYIILLTPSFTITDYSTRLTASYDIEDFSFIGTVSADQHALITSQFAPYDNWADFLSYAKEKGEILYASQNLTDRLFIQQIAEMEGFRVKIIPVSGGAGMKPLVLAGDVDLAFSGGTHSQYTDSGEMVVLATTGSQRLIHYPDAPTLNELGYVLNLRSVTLLAAPRDTPAYQLNILTDTVKKITQDPRFIDVTENIVKNPAYFINGENLKASLHLQQLHIMRLMSNQTNED